MQQDSSDPTGVSGNENSAGVVRARERKANAAVQLRIAGASWTQIADILGYPTARAAFVAFEKAMERELHTEQSQNRLRDLAGRRLDSLLRSVWGKASNAEHPEHLAAVGRARDIVDRQIKLYGLDAPAEVVIHSPSQAELDQWVARVVQTEVPALEEANIFDAEILEYEEEGEDLAEGA
jgi:hypothetical protein